MGADALEAVRSGAGSTDEETRSRCQAILTEIHRNLKAARTEAIARSVAWKLPVDAAPTDSVVVAGSLLLFVDQDDVLHAADAATGKEKWKADERIGRFAPVGPAVDGQTAYAVCFDHETFKWSVVALALADGKILWRSRAKASVSPPAVADGVVYVLSCEKAPPAAAGPRPMRPFPRLISGPDLDFEALDGKSGQSLWNLSVGARLSAR